MTVVNSGTFLVPEDSVLRSGGYPQVSFSVMFEKGGTNYFTYENEAKGYYFHMTFLRKENGCTEFGTGTDSFKFLLKEVKRKSLKVEDQLRSKLNGKFINELLAEFKNGKQALAEKLETIKEGS